MTAVTTVTPCTTIDGAAQSYSSFALPPNVVLTARESQILTLIALGYSNQEIADQLYLSINSIKTYVRSAYRRIGVERRTQAVVWAIRHAVPPVLVDAQP